jgi:hypothetical protein
MLLHGRPATEKETKDQIRSAILEVFPKIPGKDLEAIVGHAFEEVRLHFRSVYMRLTPSGYQTSR